MSFAPMQPTRSLTIAGNPNLAQLLLEVPPGLNVLAHVVDPRVGVPFDAAFPSGHKGESPGFMAFPFRAVTGGVAARCGPRRERPATSRAESASGPAAKLALAPAGGCVSVNFKLQIQTSEFMVQSAKMSVLQDIGIIRPDLEGSRGPAVCALLTCWRNG